MPKAMTKAMSHPYARMALRELRFELRREPTINEIKRKSAWFEFQAWIRHEVCLCLTHVHVLERMKVLKEQLRR